VSVIDAMSDIEFYRSLRPFDRFEQALDEERYAVVPDSWVVAITDVRGSTTAIEAGRYNDVNALGVATIAALRNALPDVDLPFVFGGDGATVLAPGARQPALEATLQGLQQLAKDAFALELRASLVPVADLRAAGHDLLVGRFRASEHASFAMLAGSGVEAAERWIKDPTRQARHEVQPNLAATADTSGFECRWRPVPSRRGVVVSLLIQALGSTHDEASAARREALERIEQIVGGIDQSCPVSEGTLALKGLSSSFRQEAALRSGHSRGLGYALSQLRTSVQTAIGRALMATGWTAGGLSGDRYRAEVVANSDFRKFDGTLRMVLDMTQEQHQALEEALHKLRDKGRIAYGTHGAPAALLTCVVDAYDGDHLHFVDGADGGYTLAAKQLKRQLQS
jgi:hypothetical protein